MINMHYVFLCFFYALLTVHPVMILINNQLDAQFFSCMFISILYMFWAAMCPSSGESLYQCDTWYVTLTQVSSLKLQKGMP